MGPPLWDPPYGTLYGTPYEALYRTPLWDPQGTLCETP